MWLVYYLYIKFVLCSLPLTEKCHEIFLLYASSQNSESLLLFLFHRNGVAFSSAEWFGKEFREFASIFVPRYTEFRAFSSSNIFSVPRNSRNSVGTNDLFNLFRLPLNYFFVGNSNPRSVVLPTIATLDRYNS